MRDAGARLSLRLCCVTVQGFAAKYDVYWPIQSNNIAPFGHKTRPHLISRAALAVK